MAMLSPLLAGCQGLQQKQLTQPRLVKMPPMIDIIASGANLLTATRKVCIILGNISAKHRLI